MKQIQYSNGTFATTAAVAESLLHYASVLAIVDSADVVSVPGVDDAGTVRIYELLVGPASQILAVDTDLAEVQLDDDVVVADLEGRSTRRLPDTTEF